MTGVQANSNGKVKRGDPEHVKERRSFLTSLVDEFKKTNAMEAKIQVLSNLANFGYDPYNYLFFGELHILSIFLDIVKSSTPGKDDKLLDIGMAGLCNLSADKKMGKGTCNEFKFITGLLSDNFRMFVNGILFHFVIL